MKRISFLASASLAAAASAAARGAGVPGGTHLVERLAEFNLPEFEAAVDRPGTEVRQVWEVVAFHPQVFANVKNALNGLQFGFGHPPSTFALAFAPHGQSGVYNYSDEIWAKYRIGDAFKLKDAAGNPVTSNVFLKPVKALDAGTDPDDPDSVFQDTSIATLQSRGVVFLTCHTAVEEHARALVSSGFAPAGMAASDVAADILTHLIPGTLVVPAMVATIAVLQARHHYTYIAPAFA